MTVAVTTRVYDPSTGIVVDGQSSMLSFGTVAPGSKSGSIVVDAVVSGVVSAGEMSLGIASSNLPEGSIPGAVYYSVLDSLSSVTEPSSLFTGVSGYDGLSNTIDVGFRTPLVSRYVALMIKAGDVPLECGCLVLKWFFGFDKEI